MKNELLKFPVLREFLGMDNDNLDDSMLSIIVQQLKDSHIELGLCISDNCMNEEAPEIVQNAMNLMAVIYDSLKGILKEQESMQ